MFFVILLLGYRNAFSNREIPARPPLNGWKTKSGVHSANPRLKIYKPASWNWNTSCPNSPTSNPVSKKGGERVAKMNTQHSSGVFKCIEVGLLPKIKIDEDRPYDSHDFKGHTDKSLTALSECLALITEMESHVLLDNSRSIVALAVLLCGENTDASKVCLL